MLRISRVQRVVSFMLLIAVGGGLLPFAQSQTTTDPAPVTMTGTVEAISNTTVVVNGLTVDISHANISPASLQVGTTIEITGTIQNGIVIATTVVIIILPVVTATPTGSPLPTLTPTWTITPGGPTVTPTPSVVSPGPIIIIEGPVQAINVNIITIFDMDIQVDAGNPILTDIVIGDVVRVEGSAVPQGNTIIIVAINITIVNIIIIDAPSGGNSGLPPGCKITKKGKIKCTHHGH